VKKSFDVYFSGELVEGHEPEAVKAAIGELFGLTGPKLEALFSGVPVRVKKNLDVERAGRYRKRFLELGALVQVVPAGQEPGAAPPAPKPKRKPAPKPAVANSGGLELAPQAPLATEEADAPPATDTSHLSLSAAGEGDLEKSEPKPAPLPDISGLTLAPLEETDEGGRPEPEPPPLPDTSHLEVLPPDKGSLEDCAEQKRPAPLPDISGLSLEE